MRKTFALLLPLAAFAVTAAAPAPGFAIGGVPFAQGDIVDARAMPDMAGGAAIMLTLAPVAAERLATLTTAHVGKPLPVTLDGRLLVAPTLAAPITEGVIEVAGHFAVAEAETLAKRISGKDPLPDSMDQ